MSAGMSQCSSRNMSLEFPITSLRILPSNPKPVKQQDISPQHVTLTQASRPSTTSAYGAFAGNLIT